jgi:hypothetical protein
MLSDAPITYPVFRVFLALASYAIAVATGIGTARAEMDGEYAWMVGIFATGMVVGGLCFWLSGMRAWFVW